MLITLAFKPCKDESMNYIPCGRQPCPMPELQERLRENLVINHRVPRLALKTARVIAATTIQPQGFTGWTVWIFSFLAGLIKPKVEKLVFAQVKCNTLKNTSMI